MSPNNSQPNPLPRKISCPPLGSIRIETARKIAISYTSTIITALENAPNPLQNNLTSWSLAIETLSTTLEELQIRANI